MSRISGIGGLSRSQMTILRQLQTLGAQMDASTERLSTLRRVNRASDDPAAITSISRLEGELAALGATQSGLGRASGILTAADSAAGEISDALTRARTLVLEAAGGTLSAAEKSANQAELDQILSAVDDLAASEYGGRRLFDGSSGFSISGGDSTKLLDIDVIDKRTEASSTVTINVTSAATKAAKSYAGGTLSGDVTLEISGTLGTTSITLSNGATTQDVTDAFNAVSHLTGVDATRVDGATVNFSSTTYGSAASVDITATSGTFATTGTGAGTDAVATINGRSVTGDGSTFAYSDGNVNLVVDVNPTTTGAITAFTVSGAGLEFQSGVSASSKSRIGLANLLGNHLGGTSGKLNQLQSGGTNAISSGNFSTALQVLDEAMSDVNAARSRVGSFQKYAIEAPQRVLAVQETTAAHQLSQIRDTDVAYETAMLNRQQLLSQAAFQALSLSNMNANGVLNVLAGL